jgi:hypothetical protein
VCAPCVALHTSKRYLLPAKHSAASSAQLLQIALRMRIFKSFTSLRQWRYVQCPSRSPRGKTRWTSDRVTVQTKRWACSTNPSAGGGIFFILPSTRSLDIDNRLHGMKFKETKRTILSTRHIVYTLKLKCSNSCVLALKTKTNFCACVH